MLKTAVVAVSVLVAGAAYAQNTQGVSKSTPGHQMQRATKSTAPGASEYAPGHKMQKATKSTAPGASEYAPGQRSTTTGSTASKTR